jgi:copper transporter 1
MYTQKQSSDVFLLYKKKDDETAAVPIAIDHDNLIGHENEASSLLVIGRDSKRVVERRGKLIMAVLYAVQVFYSFFIM